MFIQSIIAANLACFLLQQLLGGVMFQWFALWPPHRPYWLDSSLLAPWQWLSYSFLHGNVTHLAFNMFGLWMFGRDVEQVWGTRRVALAYFASVFFGAASQMLAAFMAGGGGGPVIGASAGVFGLLLAFALLFPDRRVIALPVPIPMPARMFVLLYAALELALGVSGAESGVAHFAHLGGLLGGWVVYRFATWGR